MPANWTLSTRNRTVYLAAFVLLHTFSEELANRTFCGEMRELQGELGEHASRDTPDHVSTQLRFTRISYEKLRARKTCIIRLKLLDKASDSRRWIEQQQRKCTKILTEENSCVPLFVLGGCY